MNAVRVYIVSDDGFRVGEFRSYNDGSVKYLDPDTGVIHEESADNVYFSRVLASEAYSLNLDPITSVN